MISFFPPFPQTASNGITLTFINQGSWSLGFRRLYVANLPITIIITLTVCANSSNDRHISYLQCSGYHALYQQLSIRIKLGNWTELNKGSISNDLRMAIKPAAFPWNWSFEIQLSTQFVLAEANVRIFRALTQPARASGNRIYYTLATL